MTSDDDDLTLVDVIADDNVPDPDPQAIDMETTIAALRQALDTLEERARISF